MARGGEARPKAAGAARKGPPKKDRLFVEALARGMRVLEAFAAEARPMSHSEIAQAIGADKSAAQRLTHTLVSLGYLERVATGVVPGRKLLERSFDYLRAMPLVERAIPILADLRRTVNERVDLSLFDDTSMMYVVRMQSKRDSFHAHLIGARVPTFCTSGGRAVLSHLPEAEALDIIARSDRRKITPKTVTRLEDIVAAVAQARETGYALALEQVIIGEVAVGVAVLDTKGAPVAAIHLVGSLGEWTPKDFVRRVGPLVSEAAQALRAP